MSDNIENSELEETLMTQWDWKEETPIPEINSKYRMILLAAKEANNFNAEQRRKLPWTCASRSERELRWKRSNRKPSDSRFSIEIIFGLRRSSPTISHKQNGRSHSIPPVFLCFKFSDCPVEVFRGGVGKCNRRVSPRSREKYWNRLRSLNSRQRWVLIREYV